MIKSEDIVKLFKSLDDDIPFPAIIDFSSDGCWANIPVAFIKSFKDCDVLVNILQDRRHIEDPLLLHKSLNAIFKALNTTVTHFQIGNAVNRRKWAFVSLDEYFQFFSVAQKLSDQSYPSLQLIGGSIIDFEPPNFARTAATLCKDPSWQHHCHCDRNIYSHTQVFHAINAPIQRCYGGCNRFFRTR